ncbi:hypothetical protein HDE_14404 [Halotydeus destructor]|nr:hypothetical protein HDE_14404 [Halotydeus destructor]
MASHKRKMDMPDMPSKINRIEKTLSAQVIDERPEIRQISCNRTVLTRTYKLEHNFEVSDNVLQMSTAVRGLYREMLSELITDYSDDDLISVRVTHLVDKEQDNDLYISYKRKRDITYNEFAAAVGNVCQSNSSYLLEGSLQLKVAVIRKLVGGGRNTSRVLGNAITKKQSIINSKSVIQIKNHDGAMCGYLAIAVAAWKLDNQLDKGTKWKNLCRRLPTQIATATAFFDEIGYAADFTKPVGERELTAIQRLVKDRYQIVVVTYLDSLSSCRNVPRQFVGASDSNTKLVLEFVPPETVLDIGHYNVITKLASYYKQAGFCFACFSAYAKKNTHFCAEICKSCVFADCEKEEEVTCQSCHMICFGASCLKRHEASRCKKMAYCEVCESTYRKCKSEHECDTRYCYTCDMRQSGTHHHFMKSKSLTALQVDDRKVKTIIAYDIEASQQADSAHQANLLIAHTCCDECYDSEAKTYNSCGRCGDHERVFEGTECVSQFCDYLISEVSARAAKNAYIDIYAHNAKNYDSRFLLRELISRNLCDFSLITQGSKISKMNVGNLRFIDSCALFQCGLAKLPAIFGFQDRVVKGHFPHFLNDGRAFDEFDHEFPCISKFGFSFMKYDDQVALKNWYDQEIVKNEPWIFREEIIKYCRNDVAVLMIAIQEFRSLFKKACGLDPTTRCFTLPGISMEIFQSMMLQDQTIGITPITPYSSRMKSIKSEAWLDFQQRRLGIEIEREYPLGGRYFADGFHKESNTVFEFFGCLWHGCSICYDEDKVFNLHNAPTTAGQLKKKTDEKLAYYGRRRFELVVIWECEFEKLAKLPSWSTQTTDDEDLQTMYVTERMNHHRKLKKDNLFCNVRSAYFGGRTGNVGYANVRAFLGPKSYAYEVQYGDIIKSTVKCKGITLYGGRLNKFKEFDTVLAKAKECEDTEQECGPISFVQTAIRPNRNTHELRTVKFQKKMQPRLDKRVLKWKDEGDSMFYSVPIGFTFYDNYDEYLNDQASI